MQESEKKIYYEIITKCWIAFSKQRPCYQFSDEWWEQLINDFDDIRKSYINTDYATLVNEITMSLQDEHERRFKYGRS